MANVVLFHHANGLTAGVLAFADDLRNAGHTVHTPDFYEGNVFDNLDDGVAYARSVGFGEVLARALRAAEALPTDAVYAGFSLGVLPAQQLAQTQAGARGALLFDAVVPVAEFSPTWPAGVPVQMHAMDAARALASDVADAELFLYPGDQHLFADSSLPAYDANAAALLRERVLAFLARIDG